VINRRNIFNSSTRVLHIAAEPCLQKKISEKCRGGYLTADLNNPNAMVEMDITNIEYPDESFDIIICNHVLEHIVDDRKAINELKRVAKKNGTVVLMVPIIREKTEEDFSINTPEGRLKAYGQGDHVRACGKDYVDRIRSSGFNVEIINETTLKPSEIKKYHLINDEVFLCTK